MFHILLPLYMFNIFHIFSLVDFCMRHILSLHISCWAYFHVNLISHIGPVHKGTNHVPISISDRDPLPDGSKHYKRRPNHEQDLRTAKVIVLFLTAHWPMHGFAHLQNAHAGITFRKSFAFTCPQNQAFYADHDPKRPFFVFQKRVSKAWFERALRSQRVKSGFQRVRNHGPKRLLERDSFLCEQAHSFLQSRFHFSTFSPSRFHITHFPE